MRFTQSWLAVGVIVVSVALPSTSWAKSSVDLRLERLENILENEVSADLLSQLTAMQQEVQELRGKIEVQQHEILLLTQKQEKLYLNLDSRIGSLTQSTSAIVAADPLIPAEESLPAPETVNSDQAATSDSIWQFAEQSEHKVYDNAYKLLSTKQFPQAIASFKQLLEQYPAGKFAPNAYYWLGEIYAAQWQQNKANGALLQQAVTAFKAVVESFPAHHKAVDALLKLGLVEVDQEHWVAAQALLQEVIQKYPDSSRARIAEAKLQRMRLEGHL